MDASEIRIVRLEPMHVASLRAVSTSPEYDAWQKLADFARPLGLLEDPSAHPVFGFNNPSPSPDRQEYGYEYWIKVDPRLPLEGEVEAKDFPGGLYAILRCCLGNEIASEFFQKEGYLEPWKKLYEWVESSSYQRGSHQALEKHVNPGAPLEKLMLDLCFPIEEKQKTNT